MEALQGLFTSWGPYSLTALGAAMVGFGLLSGLLLIRSQSRLYTRPYFVSAFLMSLVCFVAAALERQFLTEGTGALVKGILLLVVVLHGLALIHRARKRSLAKRSLTASGMVCAICLLFPLVPGIMGFIANKNRLVAAVVSSEGPVREDILDAYTGAIGAPLLAAAIGGFFIGLSVLILLVRRARLH